MAYGKGSRCPRGDQAPEASPPGGPERLAGIDVRTDEGQAGDVHEHGVAGHADGQLRGMTAKASVLIGQEDGGDAAFGQGAGLLKPGHHAKDVFSAGFHEGLLLSQAFIT